MKLIKLLSEELSESQFTNNLAVPLKLKPNSEIALKSLSIEFNDPKLVVDDTNNTFFFRTISEGEDHLVVLKEGEYFLNDFITEIQNKMNNVLDVNKEQKPQQKRDYGFQWTVKRRLDPQSSRINLQFFFDRKDPINITDSNSETVDMSYVGSNFIKTGADTNTYNSLVSSKILVNNGGFEMNMTLTNQGTQDIGFSEWIWGIDNMYSSKNETTQTTIIEKMLVAIGSINGYYSIKKNGAFVQQTLQIQTGDILKIHKRAGKIIYNVTRASGGLTSFEGDIINNVIPNLGSDPLTMILHVGNDTGKIAFTTIKETPNVNVKVNSGVYSIVEPTEETVYLNVNLTSVTQSLVSLHFSNNPNVLKLLGFQQDPTPINALSSVFVSTRGIEIRLITDDIIVEIPEISSIDTYVEDFRATRNAIMIIPASDLESSIKQTSLGSFILSWTETANFCFIDLSNSHDLQLPALSIRATSNGKLINVSGNMSALLLVQSKENK